MQNEYLEMHGKELLIDGIVIAEVTHIEDAIAISDRVSNYVAELESKMTKLQAELKRVKQEANKKDKLLHGLSPYSSTNWVAPYDVD